MDMIIIPYNNLALHMVGYDVEPTIDEFDYKVDRVRVEEALGQIIFDKEFGEQEFIGEIDDKIDDMIDNHFDEYFDKYIDDIKSWFAEEASTSDEAAEAWRNTDEGKEYMKDIERDVAQTQREAVKDTFSSTDVADYEATDSIDKPSVLDSIDDDIVNRMSPTSGTLIELGDDTSGVIFNDGTPDVVLYILDTDETILGERDILDKLLRTFETCSSTNTSGIGANMSNAIQGASSIEDSGYLDSLLSNVEANLMHKRDDVSQFKAYYDNNDLIFEISVGDGIRSSWVVPRTDLSYDYANVIDEAAEISDSINAQIDDYDNNYADDN